MSRVYKFLIPGGVNNAYAKAGLYMAIKYADFKDSQKRDYNGTANNMKMPIGDTSGYWGKFVLDTLRLETDSGESIIMDEAVITLKKTKNITKTQIVGGTGTVKEYISDADIDITISAALVATDYADNIIDEYPEEGIKQLRKVIDTPETIKATSKFLELFEINRIVIKDVNITQATHSNRQEITINADSDYDYTIYSEEV